MAKPISLSTTLVVGLARRKGFHVLGYRLEDFFQSLTGIGESAVRLLDGMAVADRAVGDGGGSAGEAGGFVGAVRLDVAAKVALHLVDAVQVVYGALAQPVKEPVEVV